MKRQQGLSLIELMVALLISSLLMLGATEIFSRSFFADRANTELTYMQESGRLALEIIGQDARRAGFQGCVPSDTVTSFDNGTLPDNSVTRGADDSLSFTYLPAGIDGCGGGESLATVTYATSNSNATCAGAAPCITRNGAAILNNTTLDVTFLPNDNPIIATSIEATITVSDSRTAGERLGERTFSATYELRNRLQ
ncbi:PilW family protein [Pseudomonas sp. NPDC077382]